MFAVYCAIAVTAPSTVNVTDFCPGACAAPFTIHCEKVYPAGSVAGATRFTHVPLPTQGMEQFVVPQWPVHEPMLNPIGGADWTASMYPAVGVRYTAV